MEKNVRYKIASCDSNCITLQHANKAALFNISWDELFLVENLSFISNIQLFFLGTYSSHTMHNLNLSYLLKHDHENSQLKKIILSETRNSKFLIFDVQTKNIDTMSASFLLNNLDLLESFTSIQSFFLGIRIGVFYDKSNFKLSKAD